MKQAKNPDVYKGLYGGQYCRDSPIQTQRKCDCSKDHCCAADFYADDVREIIEYSTPKKGIAGFIAESIQVNIFNKNLFFYNDKLY